MASHAIFQYNVLAIDDTHNTWTNVIVKMAILRLLGSSDDKEKIGVARPEGPPLRGFRYGGYIGLTGECNFFTFHEKSPLWTTEPMRLIGASSVQPVYVFSSVFICQCTDVYNFCSVGSTGVTKTSRRAPSQCTDVYIFFNVG